jgi:protease PrsW
MDNFYSNPLVLFALAIAPGFALSIYFYMADKYEKEPKLLLLKTFIFGGFSIYPAIYLTSFWTGMGIENDNTFSGVAAYAFIAVAFSEELAKFLVFWFVCFKNPEFDEPYDGIIYSVMVALGFATLENILYVFQYGFSVGILRMFTAVPAHATFGVLIGFFVGWAKFNNNTILISLMGLFSAIVFHGLYDFFLMKNNVPFLSFGAIIALLIAVKLSRKAIKINQELSPFK